jgi:hypothetical protein
MPRHRPRTQPELTLGRGELGGQDAMLGLPAAHEISQCLGAQLLAATSASQDETGFPA